MQFKPQETTLNSFQEVESELFDSFSGLGYDTLLAREIAHSFTKFMLGYLTAEGVAQSLLANGADDQTALALVSKFEQVKLESENEEMAAAN